MKPATSNGEIADLLERHGRLLAVAGESPFRTRAYVQAAEALRVLPDSLSSVASRGALRDIPGVGEAIATAIEQILTTGNFEAHRQLMRRYPETLIELMEVPGVGSKTVLRLFTELGIDSLPALDAALVTGRIAATKGLGARTEATIRSGVESLRRRTGRTPLGAALPIARAFITSYADARPQDLISIAGSARRWEVTVGDLDFVIGSPEVTGAIDAVGRLPIVSSVEFASPQAARLTLAGGVAADVYLTDPGSWGSTLVRATGNALHLDRLGEIPESTATEAEVYARHDLPWIPSELRTGREEFARWEEIESLVTLDAINGELHTHTTWSDGSASILAMAEAAANRGYTFLGITDHSHGLAVAGGLDPERLAAQRRELSRSDGAAGVKLLAGAEVEVHRDGRLDFDDDVLAELEVVVASLHTGLRQPSDQLTERLIRVLENPHVDIIAHPTGRLIERREGGDFDWERVFAAAAKTGTALEINADLARLDLDPQLAARAAAAECLISVNCDAHQPSSFSHMEYGVAMARRAWLTPAQIVNCWPRSQVQDWLASRERSA